MIKLFQGFFFWLRKAVEHAWQTIMLCGKRNVVIDHLLEPLNLTPHLLAMINRRMIFQSPLGFEIEAILQHSPTICSKRNC